MAEEIAYLKSELGEIASETRISLMQETFNIRTAPARILCAFEAGKGRVLSNLRLMEMAGSDAGIKTLQVYVCWLRRPNAAHGHKFARDRPPQPAPAGRARRL